MERYEIAQENAKKSLHVADHMLNVTYKLVQDPKMLLSVLERLKSSVHYAMLSVLHFERMYKRIPPFQESFDSAFNTFKARCTRRYNINVEYITLIQEVRDILRQHEKSPVEFRKDDRFVICTDNYRLRTVSIDQMKKYISKAKQFIKETENMVITNGRAST